MYSMYPDETRSRLSLREQELYETLRAESVSSARDRDGSCPYDLTYHPASYGGMASNPLYNQHLHQQMNPVSITPHPNHQRFLPHQHPLHNPQQQHVSRKRPKYSRSKLGCLSCRVRKVKCDETRPICTRCSHSQRECTWPPDVPRPKKGGSSSASDPRPDTSSGDGRNSGSDDAEDASDSGTGPGAIRTSTSAHGRLTGHSRHPSSSSLRGRDLEMTSRTDNGPRDRSPNPFAFNVSQLGPRPSGVGRPANHHHRSYSSSSATSSSSISSLPYPLVPTLRPTSVPGLSASPTHTPASALSGPHLFPSQYAHSPGLWSSADSLNSSRPSTSSSSLAAGLGGIDLNNSFGFTPVTSPIERSTFAGGDNFSFSSSFDAPSNFHQNYDMMAFGGSFDQNIPISFDPSSTIPEFDPASSFIAQLQGMDRPGSRGNYTTSLSNSSMSGSSSSGSPIDGSTSVKMEFEPVRFGEYGGGGGRGEHTNGLMSGFREAQTPMPAAGFGLTRSTPQEISINSALGSSDLSALQSHQHPTFSEMGLGDPTTLENINISTSQYLQPQGITSPGMTMATSADTKFGSTWARTHQPHHLSDNSEVRPATTGLGSQLSASLFQMGTVSPEAGAEAERYFIPGVRAGALEVEDRVTSQSPMEMREMMRVENGVQGALEGLEESGLGLFQSAEGLRSGGAEMEPLLLDTHSDSPQRTLEILEDGQASPRSQRSQASALPSLMLVQHNRSRSDTITPRNVRQLSSDALSLAKWNTQDLAGFGLVKEDEADYDSMRGVTVSAGQWGTLSPTTRLMLENPDPLEPFFNTVQERNLIRHYCHTSTQLMMALPSSLNPILSIHLPIILSFPETATSSSVSRGTITSSALEANPTRASIEALRLSLLGVASIHKSYMFAKSGPENRNNAVEMWELASRLRFQATRWLTVAAESFEGCKSDAALGACVSIALIDIFAGGHNYMSNLAIGKKLVALRGGPAAMVRSSKVSVRSEDPDTPSLKGPCHFVETDSNSPRRGKGQKGTLISSARLLLEILTVYETFGTLTSGEQTSLLRTGDSGWWFDGDKTNYHLLSVEKVFGMSRSIVELFARVSNFLNRHRPMRRKSFGNADVVQGHLTPRPSRSSTPVPTLTGLQEAPPPITSPLAPLHAEAYALLREVSSWQSNAEDATSELLNHPRVEYGNKAHKCALIILLLREAFNIPAYDSRVQRCVQMTLSAAIEASVDFVMSVDLIWPVIIAGCQCTKQEMNMRLLTATALEGFQHQCCFEIDTAKQIITEVWRRMDANLPCPDFRSVVDDLDLRVLIL